MLHKIRFSLQVCGDSTEKAGGRKRRRITNSDAKAELGSRALELAGGVAQKSPDRQQPFTLDQTQTCG